MSQKTFNLAAGAIFLAILILHVLRLIYGWEAVIGGIAIPMWASWVAIILSAYLVYEVASLARK